MKFLSIILFYYNFLAIFSWNPVCAINAWDFNFNFSDFTNQAKLVITDCNATHLEKEINRVLGGNQSKSIIQEPLNSEHVPHVTCVDDPFMGKAVKLTLYKMDELPKHGHMQHLELKATVNSKALVAHPDEEMIYSWWFFLNPSLKLEKETLSIFRLKAEGLDSHNHSLASFCINKKQGLYLRFEANARDTKPTKSSMLSLSAVRGLWIQAFVQVHYKENSGFIKVILMDILGKQLFPTVNQTGVFQADTFRRQWTSVRPKWGISRRVSKDHNNTSEYLLLQNLQIWKKN